mmetsp:Transcript_481/g.1670  ORF Transcript_481/g.1670 Transcript_481/m.1670 type:complete len:239 (+) Transcript_481:655-1371(+)
MDFSSSIPTHFSSMIMSMSSFTTSCSPSLARNSSSTGARMATISETTQRSFVTADSRHALMPSSACLSQASNRLFGSSSKRARRQVAALICSCGTWDSLSMRRRFLRPSTSLTALRVFAGATAKRARRAPVTFCWTPRFCEKMRRPRRRGPSHSSVCLMLASLPRIAAITLPAAVSSRAGVLQRRKSRSTGMMLRSRSRSWYSEEVLAMLPRVATMPTSTLSFSRKRRCWRLSSTPLL